MYKHLFFDDQKFFVRQGLRREYGKPEQTGSFVDPQMACPYSWCWALRGLDGKVNLLYNGCVRDGDKIVTGFGAAISEDGVNFRTRDTARESGFEHPLIPNQFLAPAQEGTEIGTILEDVSAPAEERYKMLFTDGKLLKEKLRMIDCLYTSPDLIRWQLKEGVCWNPEGTEPMTGAFFNPRTKKFTILTRPDLGQRRVGITETADWRTFSQFVPCLQCDSLDETLAEIYGMPAMVYDGWFIGFPHIYSGFEQEIFTKFSGGEMRMQLAYSLDGLHWQRSLRTPFIEGDMLPDGPWKMTYLNSVIRDSDGSLLLYVCATRQEHGMKAEDMMGQTSIKILRLRADGFVRFVTNGNKEGVLTLRDSLLQGGDLRINLQAKHATCAIYKFGSRGQESWLSHEDCLPFSGDSTCWRPQWRNGSIDDVVGKLIIVEVRLHDGALYSIAYDGIPLMNTQAARYDRDGILPPEHLRY